MKNKKTILWIVGLTIVFASIGLFVFKNLASWLIVSDPVPNSLDVIFTFGGEDSRITYSKILFLQNPNAQWVISYDNKKLFHALAKEGFDTSRIFIVDTCTSTFSEIAFLKAWIAQFIQKRTTTSQNIAASRLSGLSKIGLVSNWYHMRRIKLTASQKIPEKQCLLSYLCVPPSNNDLMIIRDSWWNNKTFSSIVYFEWWKILYYQLR